MPRLRTVGIGLAIGVVAAPVVAAGGLYVWISNPRPQNLTLPEGQVPGTADEATWILDGAHATADLDGMLRHHQTQQKGSWCGVASAVSVLNARGGQLEQSGFFTPAASDVRSWWQITFGGMPLADLAGLLRAHGAEATVHRAADHGPEAFRDAVKRNLAAEGDWLIVNYDRKVLGQAGGGHISPPGAYAEARDMVLVFDTATYKYPPHWVPLTLLFEAMDTPDNESGDSRGWVEVR